MLEKLNVPGGTLPTVNTMGAVDFEYEEIISLDDYEDKAEDDMWDDDVEPDYNPPRVNITEKKKERIPEYEDG